MQHEHAETYSTRAAGLDEAIALARRVHSLHHSRDGRPYFDHAAAVLERTDHLLSLVPIEAMGPDEADEVRIVAILHDVVEERRHTGIDAATLLGLGFRQRAVDRIVRLSGRPEGVSYQDNILALVAEGDLGLLLVKLADNDHNMDPVRIAALPEEDRGILRRYARSSTVLAAEVSRRIGVPIGLPLRPDAPVAGMAP
jgi:(p)ppGpp synthase/HD superfamily hydrolase